MPVPYWINPVAWWKTATEKSVAKPNTLIETGSDSVLREARETIKENENRTFTWNKISMITMQLLFACVAGGAAGVVANLFNGGEAWGITAGVSAIVGLAVTAFTSSYIAHHINVENSFGREAYYNRSLSKQLVQGISKALGKEVDANACLETPALPLKTELNGPNYTGAPRFLPATVLLAEKGPLLHAGKIEPLESRTLQ